MFRQFIRRILAATQRRRLLAASQTSRVPAKGQAVRVQGEILAAADRLARQYGLGYEGRRVLVRYCVLHIRQGGTTEDVIKRCAEMTDRLFSAPRRPCHSNVGWRKMRRTRVTEDAR